MSNEDGTVWVSYNGEIYNHRELRSDLESSGHAFRSATDTEVLVHLYEGSRDIAAMLSRLRGMFAFAIFDSRRGRLLLARDRLGIKPLYYAETPGGLAFASEVKALVHSAYVGSDIDHGSVLDYLRWGVVPGPRSIMSGVREIEPGSALTFENGTAQLLRWWRPEVETGRALADDAEPLLRAALSDSVERHLLADRPVGVFLSGGVDSRTVATLASRNSRIRALTVSFPDTDDDEAPLAAEIAEEIGADHQTVPVTGEDVAGAFPEILRAMDQPTADGINTWLVCKAARDAGLVVALSGLGGDELFGGYPTFRSVPRLSAALTLASIVPRPIRHAAARAASRRRPGGGLARALSSSTGLPGAYAAFRGLFGSAELPGLDHRIATNGGVPARGHDGVMLQEMDHYLANQLLRDTDQMSMSHSLEVRVPLLDDTVVRVALALPSDVRLAAGKDLLVRAAGIAPGAAKRPFSLPFGLWLRGPLRETVRGALLSDDLPFRDELDRPWRARLWEALEGGRVHWSRPWAITVLRLWPEANGFRW